ncbi:MAG: arylesterase [Gemmatimonadales bacterium]
MIHQYARTFLIVSGLAACGSEPPPAVDTPAAPPVVEGVTIGVDARPLIVFLGTSLTAGLGLSDPSQAYPGVIQAKLDSAGLGYRVVNAGISGETSAGALRRVDWVMSQGEVAVLFVETGANDGLRGQDPDTLRANLEAIFERALAQDPPPRLILAGMEAPPNLGREYTARFRAVYPEVARTNGAMLLPFLLEGVAGVESLNQPDGIHPTAEGQRQIAELVWGVLRPALGSEP